MNNFQSAQDDDERGDGPTVLLLCGVPMLKVGKHYGSTVPDGLSGDSAHSAGRVALAIDGLVEGCDSHQRTRAEYARIYILR